MINKEILKKQIIYRSTHRGSKEMDLLLGTFVKKNIDKFSDIELKNLENLMKMEDEILQKWYFEKKIKDSIFINNVSQMFIKFKL